MVSKINGAKAQITLKEVSFRQCFTCSEFIKRYADLGKIHSQDKMQLFITDPAQVLADDPFLDVAVRAAHPARGRRQVPRARLTAAAGPLPRLPKEVLRGKAAPRRAPGRP